MAYMVDKDYLNELDGQKMDPFHSVHEAIMNHPDHKSDRYLSPLAIQASFRGTNSYYMGEHDGGTTIKAGRPVKLKAAASRSHFAEVYADTANKVMQSLWSSSDLLPQIVSWASIGILRWALVRKS